jgi:tetratricopeptide (TPR) repeat protein
MQNVSKIFSAFLLFFTTPFFINTKIKKTAPTPSLASTIAAKADAYDHFMQATYLHAKGDTPGALSAFEGIMKIHPSEHALEPYLQVLFDAESFPTIIKVYEGNKTKIDHLFATNYLLKGFIAQAYLSTNKEQKATTMFQELMRDHGNDVQLCYFAAVGHLKTKRLPAAIKLLQQCLDNPELKNKHYLFHFLLSKAYLETHRPTEAMACIEKSITQFPRFDRGWLFKAILHEQQGKIADAIHGYKKFLDISGRDHSIEKQLVQLLFMEQRFGEAVDYLKKLSSDAPEYCFDLALVQSKSGAYTEALPTINKVLAHDPTLEKAKLLKVEILLNGNKTDDAVAFLQDWLSQEPHNLGVLHTFLLLRQGDVPAKKLIAALETVQIKQPDNLGIVAALGDLSCEAQQPEKALSYYEQASNCTAFKKLKSKIYFQRCYIMFKQRDHTALNTEIARAEREECCDHSILNLQAYYYAHTNQQLDKALAAIDKALAAKPGRPAYLDTKASVLAKMGKSHDALLFAQKALLLAPEDTLIQQHVEELKRNAHQPSRLPITHALRSRR